MARDKDLADARTASHSGTWVADYSARFAKTAEETARASATAAGRWVRRSLADDEWTVDAVTADIVTDWEEMTPLLGQWLACDWKRSSSRSGGVRRRER